MENNPKQIVLDDCAQKLFEELGGLRKRRSPKGDHMAQSLDAEQKKADDLRILLIELTHLLSSYFLDVRFLKEADTEQELFDQLSGTVSKLRAYQSQEPTLLIRFRGFPNDPNTAENVDYEILFGNFSVDCDLIPAIIKRQGFRMSHLADQARRAFGVLLEQGVYSLYLTLPDNTPDALERLRMSLQIVARFNEACRAKSPILLDHPEGRISLPLISDEKKQPDPNLTLVAGINGLKPQALEALVTKIDAWMRKQATVAAGNHFTSAYSAIFGIAKLRQRLIKPPIEINSIKWLMVDRDHEIVSHEKAQVAKLVVATFGQSPRETARVLKSVYGNDFDRINSQHLGERLHLSSGLLNAIGHESHNQGIKKEVIGNIKTRLDKVRDEVFDDLFIGPDGVKSVAGGKETVFGRLNTHLHKLATFFKRRSATRQKMKTIVYHAINFDEQDYDTLAKDYDISVEDARNLIAMLRQCFDDEGHFIKGAFAAIMPAFANYERKIFEFLWHYLKEAIKQQDRVSFLNSLQVLTARMKQPKRAFRILLDDFCASPQKVSFSDSKAVMLAILIVRKYNKELIDIEITPEDVLLVREGLDPAVARYAAWKIDQDQEKFFEKVRTVHERLKTALDTPDLAETPIPPTYLLGLEREIYIFMALIAGNAGRSVVRSALKEYGNPAADLYRLARSADHLPLLIKNLRVVIRGIGRLGNSGDLGTLNEIRSHQAAFIDLGKGTRHHSQVLQIMEWAAKACDDIAHQGG